MQANSVNLKNICNEFDTGDYFTVMQQFKAKHYIGKRVRMTGFVKARGVTGWGGLWMRIDNITANVIKLDNMQNRAITGDIGMLLYGAGELWIDNLAFEVVEKNIPTTDVDISSALPEKPNNLSFEDA